VRTGQGLTRQILTGGLRGLGNSPTGFSTTATGCDALVFRTQSPAASLDEQSAESWAMLESARQTKITFGVTRESGFDRIPIYCADDQPPQE